MVFWLDSSLVVAIVRSLKMVWLDPLKRKKKEILYFFQALIKIICTNYNYIYDDYIYYRVCMIKVVVEDLKELFEVLMVDHTTA